MRMRDLTTVCVNSLEGQLKCLLGRYQGFLYCAAPSPEGERAYPREIGRVGWPTSDHTFAIGAR